MKVWLHSTSDASPPPPQRGCRVGDPGPAALLLLQILPVLPPHRVKHARRGPRFSVVAPCRRGASLVSVRRQTFTTGCWARRAEEILEATGGRDASRHRKRPRTIGHRYFRASCLGRSEDRIDAGHVGDRVFEWRTRAASLENRLGKEIRLKSVLVEDRELDRF